MLSVRQRWALGLGFATLLLGLGLGLGVRSHVGRALVKTYLPGWAPAAPLAVKPSAPPLPESVFDCEPAPIPWIEPGTLVDREPPPDWSHLVIKNDTQVTSGDSGADAERWIRLAAMFSLAVLADVDLDATTSNYYLARLGLGWCEEVDGRSMIISTATYRKLGAKFDVMQTLSLGMREIDCDDNVRIIARAASSLFYDVKRVLAYDEGHLEGRLRHAILVHPRTGELAAFLWIVPALSKPPPTFIERLPPNLVTTFELQYRRGQGTLLSMPSPTDFAVRGVPVCAERVPMTPSLSEVALEAELTPENARQLETLLRSYLNWR